MFRAGSAGAPEAPRSRRVKTANTIRPDRPGSGRMIRMGTADRLRWILDLVEESLDQPELTGDGLAARAYLSRFHFDPRAAAPPPPPPGARPPPPPRPPAALGEPPGAFRRRLLLERAAHRLASTAD